MKRKKSFDDIIADVINNVLLDRQKASKFLQKYEEELENQGATVSDSGNVAAKLIESMQRSNETLIRAATLKAKTPLSEEDNLSNDDLYGMINDNYQEEIKAQKKKEE